MSKKKKSIELHKKSIVYQKEKDTFKVQRFHPTSMTIDVLEIDQDGKKLGEKNIAFAHLPKEVKKMIKPN